MRFVLYSEKTVAQCLTAINERMHAKETSTRPALDGWIEKSGTFSISLTAPVVGRFTRRTALSAKVERESGVTVIQGSVPSGVSREGQAFVFIALALVALALIGSGSVLFGLLLIPIAAYLYIPLHGDYLNSAALVDEVERTLKAKQKPPKKLSEGKAAPRTPARSAASAAKPPAAKKPAAKPAAKKPAAKPAVRQPAAPPDEFPQVEEFPPIPGDEGFGSSNP